jgi:predicted ATP-grasp superfamily ATP-dependent carboligase
MGIPSGAVVIGGYANGLTVVRALSKLAHPIALIVTRQTDIAQYSKWTAEAVPLLDFHSDPESLVDLLLYKKSCWGGRALFPTNDHAATVLARNRERLSRHFRVVMPDWGKAKNLLDKQRTMQLADRLGIATPKNYGLTNGFSTAGRDITFPVIIKPKESHLFYERFRKKLILAKDSSELKRALRLIQSSGLEGLIQDWIPGTDNCYYNYSVFIDRFGEPKGGFSMHKLRKAPPFFGVCRVAETCDKSALREPTLSLLKEIGWRGMANAEYKLDSRDGHYKLMEINGRCFLMQGLPLKAGVNYPAMAYGDLNGENLSTFSDNGWQGVWIHIYADMIYSILSWPREKFAVSDYAVPYIRPKTFAVWDRRDPRPFLAQWSKSPTLALRLFRAGGTRSLTAGIESIPREDNSNEIK